MSDTFKTISSISEGIYKEKGSKFLSFAHPVNNIEEVKELVKKYRKEYFDARHVCYAFVLGAEHNEWRANDDGEPSGTAGRPIIGQINSRGLTNILVIVVRYFRGVLLGTGGLVVAYKEATADALCQAEIIEKTVDYSFTVYFDYLLLNDIMRLVKENNAQILSQSYDNDCFMNLSIRKQEAETFIGKIRKIDGVRIELMQ